MELPEKLEAALVKYLQGIVQAALTATTLPAYFDPDTQIQPGESAEDITDQILRCVADDATQEYPPDTGNFWSPIMLELRTPAREQTETEAASEDVNESVAQLDKHKALAALLTSAVMVDNLPDLLNAAAVTLGEGYELTVMRVLDRLPQRGQTSDIYMSGFTLRLYAAGSAL